MCGIVGYIGSSSAKPVLLNALSTLEYRGYDSCGIAVKNGSIAIHKDTVRVEVMQLTSPALDGTVGIGHTRWATHGKPNTINSHPHLSGDVAVVHNGIIENYLELKEKLIGDGYTFKSETDTEVIAHLLHSHLYGGIDGVFKLCDLMVAVQRTLLSLEGSYAIAALCSSDPGLRVVARKDSPLVIGVGNDEIFAASDVTAFLQHTKDVVFVDDNPSLNGLNIAGLTVISPAEIEKTIARKRIERVILAIPSLSEPRRTALLERLTHLNCEFQTLPSFLDILDGKGLASNLKTVSANELLGRDAVELDLPVEKET